MDLEGQLIHGSEIIKQIGNNLSVLREHNLHKNILKSGTTRVGVRTSSVSFIYK